MVVITPYNSIKGIGSLVELLIAAKDYPDPIKATDAICLFVGNVLASQGKPIIRAVLPHGFSPDYYTKMLGLEAEVAGRDVKTDEPSIIFWGTTKSVMQAVLKRRPEWALSL